MAKQVNCSFCSLSGETVAMTVKDNSFFKCTDCGAELHLNDDGDDTFIRNWQQQQMHISRSLQPGTHIVGGGDPVGKPKTEAMKKKSVGALRHNLDEKRFY